MPNRATFEAVQKDERQTAALHPEVPLVERVDAWLHWDEVHPDKRAEMRQAYAREFAALGMDPQAANFVVGRAVGLRSGPEVPTRERYAQQIRAERAIGQMTGGEWNRIKGDIGKWLSATAPKVAAMLAKSGAGNDEMTMREILFAWRSARSRGRA
ncbi:MAG: hypothetical protein IT518_09830 [Burkholderiales bacterium]|nr:hypothetical protein [Burkholderiales bacterium]